MDRALELDPGFVEARVSRARLTNIAGDPTAARLEIEAVLTEHPNLASAHFQMGILQLANSDFRDAALSFWWSLLDDPTRPEAHSAAATVLFADGAGPGGHALLPAGGSDQRFPGEILRADGVFAKAVGVYPGEPGRVS